MNLLNFNFDVSQANQIRSNKHFEDFEGQKSTFQANACPVDGVPPSTVQLCLHSTILLLPVLILQ